jgi:hypothetical protein
MITAAGGNAVVQALDVTQPHSIDLCFQAIRRASIFSSTMRERKKHARHVASMPRYGIAFWILISRVPFAAPRLRHGKWLPGPAAARAVPFSISAP